MTDSVSANVSKDGPPSIHNATQQMQWRSKVRPQCLLNPVERAMALPNCIVNWSSSSPSVTIRWHDHDSHGSPSGTCRNLWVLLGSSRYSWVLLGICLLLLHKSYPFTLTEHQLNLGISWRGLIKGLRHQTDEFLMNSCADNTQPKLVLTPITRWALSDPSAAIVKMNSMTMLVPSGFPLYLPCHVQFMCPKYSSSICCTNNN